MGDKSQLVCMALAARYRARPVLLGAIAAFSILNLLAVLLGAAASQWIPQTLLTIVVGILFLGFGLHALKTSTDTEDDEELPTETTSHSIFVSTLLLIMLAELGDKTQLAVAGLASTSNIYAVWIGATIALALTSGLGVWAGSTWLKRIPLTVLHRISGSLFILFGLLALSSLLLST
jgi:putative Ca2+/H+ antiporter (TMEM165/GDT1 family)